MGDALNGRVAIVTGAGKGLGRAIAERFGAEGATVVVSDIDEAAAKSVADGIAGASYLVCDVRDEEQVQALVAHTVERHGGLHVMVPNAGVGRPEPLLEMDLAAWRAVTSVNLDGVFLSIRYAAPAIIAAGGGTIVTLASVTATTGSPLIGHYAAAKAAVVNLTKTAATEFRPHGVRVNALLPGFIDTDLVTAAQPGFEAALGLPAGGFDGLIAQKQGGYGTPADVAEAALFFASERSRFCTGSGLVLDGGLDASLL
ncbi:SDR family oxidoreductase [Pseudonocardia sp. EV170527-09]|uniref:SDR family NAD(P)-dependent oxidoreductase n=1 Tax=Pseudonocardia sp. EV170527-09 TaxID=2603411 RepID=UPI0011F3D726|nr:SDR family oxidoreductase [Pseudonocardia sp. EV170527-09]KAA1029033.1 SDR family oxidoreductase [Pseudonocardia sp. EV170527-09]